MKYERFIGQVHHRLELADQGEAARATRAVLTTLGERLDTETARNLADYLPMEIDRYLTEVDNGQEFPYREFMNEFGLDPDENGVYVMAELPSNILLADQFSELFDGFSIGTNDLTQLVLGIDRNSAKLAPLFQEDNEAVERFIRSLIETVHDAECDVGICGDAPSTIPGYVQFLLDADIDSISVTPDVALETITRVAEIESGRGN